MPKLKLLPRDRYPRPKHDNPLPLYYWPVVSKVLGDSNMVHHARFTVLGNPPRYLQILTEYDTEFRVYTDFFADNLKDFFKVVFALVEGVPPPGGDISREDVYKLVGAFDVPCLGHNHFTSFGGRTVKEIKEKFDLS